MDIVEQLKWRYAVKKFDEEKSVSEDKIDKLKKVFNLTATSYGLQPIRLVIIKNKRLQQQLVPFSYDQHQVAQASHVLVICTENSVNTEYITRYFEQVKKVRGTSEDILNPFKEALVTDFSNKKAVEIQQWAINQAYLALGNLLTVCAMEEIDSCPMEGFQSKLYDKTLDLNKMGLTSVLVLPVGYRALDDMFSGFKKVRKDLKDSIIEIS